jgi:hypothetical protein
MLLLLLCTSSVQSNIVPWRYYYCCYSKAAMKPHGCYVMALWIRGICSFQGLQRIFLWPSPPYFMWVFVRRAFHTISKGNICYLRKWENLVCMAIKYTYKPQSLMKNQWSSLIFYSSAIDAIFIRLLTHSLTHSLTHALPGATTHVGSWPTQVIEFP